MNWRVHIADRARKTLARFPREDRSRLLSVLEEMQTDPFQGDIVRLKGQTAAWRRRVGAYRILFDVHRETRVVNVVDIARRTSTTY